MRNFLSRNIGLSEEDIYELEGKFGGLEDCEEVLVLLLKDFLEENPDTDLHSFLIVGKPFGMTVLQLLLYHLHLLVLVIIIRVYLLPIFIPSLSAAHFYFA